MKILAIDCSTQACSVALLNESVDNGADILERHELAARSHTQRILPMIDELLASAQCSLSQLDAIAFGRGPGSFTGLRIGLGVVQGLAFGADRPILGVSSLAALAQTALHELSQQSSFVHGPVEQILSTIDARMDEIYWGVFDVKGDRVDGGASEQLTSAKQLVLPETSLSRRVVAVGTGLSYLSDIACRDQLLVHDAQLLPRARSVAELARFEFDSQKHYKAEQALPNYLRNEVAWSKHA